MNYSVKITATVSKLTDYRSEELNEFSVELRFPESSTVTVCEEGRIAGLFPLLLPGVLASLRTAVVVEVLSPAESQASV